MGNHLEPGKKVKKRKSDPLQQNEEQIAIAGAAAMPSPVSKQDSPAVTTQVCKAVYDYDGKNDLELSFKKGEQLEIIDDTLKDWWVARSRSTKKEGYIPYNYVTKLKSIESEPWYFGKLKRNEAESLLVDSGAIRGTYLVRESETIIGSYSLSVKDVDSAPGGHVKHYKIQTENNGGFFIFPEVTFNSLQELIQHYTRTAGGLCYMLKTIYQKSNQVLEESHDQWEISLSVLHFISILASGEFGEVWKGKWNRRIDVAIKTLKPGQMSSEDFLKEAQLMTKLEHPNLVHLHGICSKETPICIVMEYIIHGSLLTYMKEREKSSTKLRINMAAQITCGMSYLEIKNYIHRDLAARNVFVGENDTFKVGDFGLARLINDREYIARRGAKFPFKWTAPEAIKTQRFTIKSDVWSFGILLVEIFTHGETPYGKMTNREVLDQVEQGYRIPCPPDCPDAIYGVMTKCWDANDRDRPTFEFLNNYFKKILIKLSDGTEVVEDVYEPLCDFAPRTSKQEGYIPVDNVANLKSLESEPWYHGRLTRKEAERLLMAPGIIQGTYLVRESETDPNSYSLSMKDIDVVNGDHVIHYKIKRNENGGFFIFPKVLFNTLHELIFHYSEKADGLKFMLTKTCPVSKPALGDLSK